MQHGEPLTIEEVRVQIHAVADSASLSAEVDRLRIEVERQRARAEVLAVAYLNGIPRGDLDGTYRMPAGVPVARAILAERDERAKS